ncbi:MAG: ribose 5-phosphate isomerase B [Firmicutes bacterium]|nr:ribose 5-phosphate isomerase B [Bacillota bacterium]
MKIALSSDHGGFDLKENLKEFLHELGHTYVDFGCSSRESVDYPDYSAAASRAVSSGECQLGIVVCGTGIGVAITANKIPGIRAANCSDCFSARMAREHNNANVLTLGQRVLGAGLAREIVRSFLDAEFAGGRHQARVDKIMALESADKC